MLFARIPIFTASLRPGWLIVLLLMSPENQLLVRTPVGSTWKGGNHCPCSLHTQLSPWTETNENHESWAASGINSCGGWVRVRWVEWEREKEELICK